MNIKKIIKMLYYRNPILIPIHNFFKKFRNKKKPDGVNLIGYPNGNFGLGEHMRIVTYSFKNSSIKFCLNDLGQFIEYFGSDFALNDLITKKNIYNINVFCLNGIDVNFYMTKTMNGIVASQYNIGYGYWELPKYPREFSTQFKYLNEIWAPTKFIFDALVKATDLPVHHVPIAVDFDIPTHITRKEFKLPENQFLFLFSFSLGSFINRKNPHAVLECFKNGFGENDVENVGLVIKVQRIKGNKEQDILHKQLQLETSQKNIYLIDDLLDREGMYALINCCDVYVSLHRAEGFGLGMAEAMKMGKNVIGTAYSGNMDFMNESNSCLVPYDLIELKEGDYQFFEKGTVWAEPDKEKAIEFMKKLYINEEFRNKMRKNAQDYMDKYHSFEYIAKKYEEQIERIKNHINIK
jgi:glycosyltransferase involved in cell wall biosynthesis